MTIRELVMELICHDPYTEVMVAVKGLGATEITRVEVLTRPTESVVVDTTGVVVRKRITPGTEVMLILLRVGGE